MKKRLLLLVNVSFLFFIKSYSQARDNQLSVSIGPSFPLGSYADKNLSDEKSGIATTGGSFYLSYVRKTQKKINIVASLRGQINPLDRSSIERSFSEFKISFGSFIAWSGSGPPPVVPQNGTSYSNWKFEESSWDLAALLLGGYKEFNTGSSRIILTSKLQAGPVYASSPKLSGSSITDTTIIQVSQTSASSLGIGYLASAGIKIKTAENVCVLANLEYFGTNNITFKNIVAKMIGVKNMSNPATMVTFQNTVSSNSKQTISSINFCVGIGVRL